MQEIKSGSVGDDPKAVDNEEEDGARIEPLDDGRFEISFYATPELLEKIERARELLGPRLDPDDDVAEIVERGLALYFAMN
jgi:hypothetical protein